MVKVHFVWINKQGSIDRNWTKSIEKKEIDENQSINQYIYILIVDDRYINKEEILQRR